MATIAFTIGCGRRSRRLRHSRRRLRRAVSGSRRRRPSCKMQRRSASASSPATAEELERFDTRWAQSLHAVPLAIPNLMHRVSRRPAVPDRWWCKTKSRAEAGARCRRGHFDCAGHRSRSHGGPRTLIDIVPTVIDPRRGRFLLVVAAGGLADGRGLVKGDDASAAARMLVANALYASVECARR